MTTSPPPPCSRSRPGPVEPVPAGARVELVVARAAQEPVALHRGGRAGVAAGGPPRAATLAEQGVVASESEQGVAAAAPAQGVRPRGAVQHVGPGGRGRPRPPVREHVSAARVPSRQLRWTRAVGVHAEERRVAVIGVVPEDDLPAVGREGGLAVGRRAASEVDRASSCASRDERAPPLIHGSRSQKTRARRPRGRDWLPRSLSQSSRRRPLDLRARCSSPASICG